MTNNKTHLDNLAELRRRKMELKARMEQERGEMKATFQELRKEIEPANLLKNAIKGSLGFAEKSGAEPDSGLLSRLPGPIRLFADLFIRDPKTAFLVKFVAPVALKLIPSKEQVQKSPPYKRLRQGIANFRQRLRKNKDQPPPAPAE